MNLRYSSLQQLEVEMEACLGLISSTHSHIEHTAQVTKLIGMLNELPEWPVSQFSQKWHQHDLLLKIMKQYFVRLDKSVIYWLYLSKAIFSAEEMALIKRRLKWMRGSQKHYLLAANVDYNSPEFIRIVYMSQCDALIAIYRKYLAKPGLTLFMGHRLPQAYIEELHLQDMAAKVITMDVSYRQVESAAKVMQRALRAKARLKSERARIGKLYPHVDIDKVLADANKPYVPQFCSEALQVRLLQAAGKITCFTRVSHYTSLKHLASVFDDGICGRQTLRNRLLAFEPAALHKDDILNGDADTICLGTVHVDPDATKHGVQIMFDAAKLAANNRAVFVKQKDFGLALDVIRSVKLKNREIHFSYTHFDVESQDVTSTLFCLFDSDGGGGTGHYEHRQPNANVVAHALCENHFLMTANRQHMHAILVMNLFRFIDRLRYDKEQAAEALIAQIYADINSLSDEELQIFMADLATKMTDSLEFNIQGCHLIDFDSVISIALTPQRQTEMQRNGLTPVISIKLTDLIAELNCGQSRLFELAQTKLQTIFNSQRFLAYLISQVKHPVSLEKLRVARENTPLVKWYGQLSSLYKKPDSGTAVVQLQRYSAQ